MEVGADLRPLYQRPLGGPDFRSFDYGRKTAGQVVVADERKGPHQAGSEATAGVGTPDVGIAGPRGRWREGVEYVP